MIKTVLVAASGGDSDSSVFQTALAIARPLRAHLNFYHLLLTPDETAALAPNTDFAVGEGLKDALDILQSETARRSAAAVRHFQAFVERNQIRIVDSPDRREGLTASWLEESGDAARRLLLRARHNDLAVVSHPRHAHGLPNRLVAMLLGSGRPVVIAPPEPREAETGVVMVGWSESAEAAHALTAAMPILAGARRVILVNVAESGPESRMPIEDLAAELSWHGVSPEAQVVEAKGRSTAQALHDAAEAERADLLVIGGFGRSRWRELLFGGVTEAFLEGANLPVFIVH